MADLDPEVAAAVESIAEEGYPLWAPLSVESARAVEDELFSAGSGPETPRVREFGIDGPGGDLPVRTYRPTEATRADGRPPTTVFYHGGGFALGTLDSADDLCRELAHRTGSLVCSVDYRRAPEHPFPAAVADAVAALQWASEHAAAVGGDPERPIVAGTSAGGNLAAATALWARENGPELGGQALLYPMLDPPDADATGEAPLLSVADVRWFWDLYLRSPLDRYNPLAVPARADPAGVAPAVVVTAGDVLREEGRAYADRLDRAGVAVEALDYPGMAHGFCSLTDDASAADAAMDDVAAAIDGLR
jgi:acetyl esterase